MVVRKHPRFPVSIAGTLVQQDRLRYPGALRDLSIKGCRVESLIRPFTGMQLEVRLEFPGEATPVTVAKAAVRWTGSGGIGIEFLTVTPAEQERLNRLVRKLSGQVGHA
jgi:hypothetical protein